MGARSLAPRAMSFGRPLVYRFGCGTPCVVRMGSGSFRLSMPSAISESLRAKVLPIRCKANAEPNLLLFRIEGAYSLHVDERRGCIGEAGVSEKVRAACTRSTCREEFLLCFVLGSSSKSSKSELGAVDVGEWEVAEEAEWRLLDEVCESWLHRALVAIPMERLRGGITIEGRLPSMGVDTHMLRLGTSTT